MAKAWIEPIKTITGTRYRVLFESVLFPGARARSVDSWATKRGAREFISRCKDEYVAGPCPLAEVTDADRAAYRHAASRAEA